MRKAGYLILIITGIWTILFVGNKQPAGEGEVPLKVNGGRLPAQLSEQSISVKVKTLNDTAEEFLADGRMQLYSSDLEFIQENSDQIVGIRFRSVHIPRGANVVKSYIQFTVDEVGRDPTYLTFCGELSADSAPFQRMNYDISGRPQTIAKVDWLPEPWLKSGDRGSAQRSSDLSVILSEIVAQKEWRAGNAVSFIVNGTGKRVASSAKRDKGVNAPVLHVWFTGQN